MNSEQFLSLRTPARRKTLAVAAAQDEALLKTLVRAYERGIAAPLLVGDQSRIRTIAAKAGLDLSPFPRIHASTEREAAKKAVELVRSGEAEVLMKGMLQTAVFLRAVLDREEGLRGEGLLSHVAVLHSPYVDRMLLLTDGAITPAPDLSQKVQMVQNAVRIARRLGVLIPKVAPLAAVEVVNPAMQATVDAALLTMMNRRGQIQDCVIDGPLAMDLALSQEAARRKGIQSDVAGRADILLFPAIEAANSVLKTFTFAGDSLFGGLVAGAAAPIVLSSRADSEDSKLYSIACAASVAGA